VEYGENQIIEFFSLYGSPGIPLGSLKNVSPFGPAVRPSIGKIYTNVLFYYMAKFNFELTGFLKTIDTSIIEVRYGCQRDIK